MLDDQKVRQWVEAATRLTAEKFALHWMTDADEEKLGLAAPWLTIELTIEETDEPIRLRISGRGEGPAGGRYADVTGVQGAVLLSGSTIAKLAVTLQDLQQPR